MDFAIRAGLLLLALPTQAFAQERVPVTPADCSAASTALTSLPTPLPTADAWVTATACGAQGGTALAIAIPSLASKSDTLLLSAALNNLSSIKDGAVFAALLLLAKNTAAQPAARMTAFQGLLAEFDPSLQLTSSIGVSPESSGGCRPVSVANGAQATGNPMPSDFVTQLGTAAASVAATSSAPTTVKNAARCVLRLIRPTSGPAIDPAKLSLTYVCGRRFKIQNTNPDGVTLQFTVNDTLQQGDLGVPGAKTVTLVTAVVGTVRLYLAGQLIQTRANGGTTCPQ